MGIGLVRCLFGQIQLEELTSSIVAFDLDTVKLLMTIFVSLLRTIEEQVVDCCHPQDTDRSGTIGFSEVLLSIWAIQME